MGTVGKIMIGVGVVGLAGVGVGGWLAWSARREEPRDEPEEAPAADEPEEMPEEEAEGQRRIGLKAEPLRGQPQ
jgi:hypothetical protein